MSQQIDRELVQRLLKDGSLSYREIARQASCSDWSVRAIAREGVGDSRPMKGAASAASPESAAASGWIVLVAIVAFVGLTIWISLPRDNPTDD